MAGNVRKGQVMAGRKPWDADPDARREAKALAKRYANGATVRSLVSDTGRSYGYVYSRVSALTDMRPRGRARGATRDRA